MSDLAIRIAVTQAEKRGETLLFAEREMVEVLKDTIKL